MKKVFLFTTMLVLAAPSLADPPSQQPAQPAAQQAKPEQPKQICRIERGSASLVHTRRICHTAEEWNRLSSDASQTMDNMARTAGHDQAAMMANAGRMP